MTPGLPSAQVPEALRCLSIADILAAQAKRCPDAVAILSPGHTPLTYGRLWWHVDNIVRMLHAMGVGRNDRAALVLPNGPEMAVAFLAVAAGATCVPLNIDYAADEFDFCLADLHAKVLLIQKGMASPARTVAQARGLHLIELSPIPGAEAGLFTLSGKEASHTGHQGFALPDDVALILHTSGTTAQPKRVPLTHSNICASAFNMQEILELTDTDRALNVMPLFHTHGLIATLLTSLIAGASVVCPPSFDASKFFAWLEVFRPTWYSAVPTIHQAVLARATLHRDIVTRSPLRFIRSASASLAPRVFMELEKVFNAPVVEAYGLTETSTAITCNPLPPRPRKIASVGIAVGTAVAIMREDGVMLPEGQIGEIVVRGMSVMQGYDNDPTANQRAFVHGWFRTGDEGYLDSDGYLFITGRLKELINRGGEKIAPQEVDATLLDHPAVTQALTFATPHPRLGEDVAAAVVLRQGATVTEKDIRQFVAERLAGFKVPRRVFIVADLPKGATGKLRRLELAAQLGLTAPILIRSNSNIHSTVPRTPVEELLAGFWAQIFGVECVGIHDDFFALGGDSIMATQLLSLIREAMQLELSFLTFFKAPTIADMARCLETTSQAVPEPQALPLHAVSRDGPLPLSFAQQRLWFLEQLGLSHHAYHLLEVIRLRGSLNVVALTQSFQEITRRHEVLRTTFVEVEGQPFQVIRPATLFSLPVIDLRGLPECEWTTQVQALACAEVQRPFDLTHGPLIRAVLACLADAVYVLLLTMHHIVSDGWSHGVFWRELAVLYEGFTIGQPALLADLFIQYADFASWQQQWLQGEVLDAQLSYWKQQLAGVPMLQLPTDHPRPAVQTFRGAQYFLVLSQPLTQALKVLSQRRKVTLFMTLLAAFLTLLHRYTGQDDIAVGSLIANRNRAEIEGLIGFFVNTLVLRTDLSGDPRFSELLERVRKVALGAYSHQDLPYEKLLEELRPPRELSHNPLFQVLFVLHNTPQQAPEFPGLCVSPLEVDPETARFDVTLDLWETPEGLQGRFEYNTDLFEAVTMARMAGHLHTLLEGIVADPEQCLSRLPLLTAGEVHHLLVSWNDTSVKTPQAHCLHELFEAQVTRTPDAIAVVDTDHCLTYYELSRRANQVAHYLQTLGVGSEVLVGLCIERSLAMMVGLLGILKAGAAYVPLDPSYPRERLAFMLADAQVSVLLTQAHLVAALPAHRAKMVCLDTEWESIARHCDQTPLSRTTASNLAYLLYTSGSTGKPKGVLGVHCATLNALSWMWEKYPFTTQEICCQKTPVSFGDSIQEIFSPLLQGIQTVLIPHNVLKDPEQFVHTLAMHHVTRLILVPSFLRVLLETCGDLACCVPDLQLWFAGGESMPSDLCHQFHACLPHSRLVNLYGASEVSDDTTWYDTNVLCSDLGPVPIGRPVANTQVYVLDRHLQPVPIGIPGELHAGGVGLTRGYVKDPDLTAEKFIPHPFSNEPGARLYKTGDVACWLPDGNISYLGRLDHQVKLRGFRIELGEIETLLKQHPMVQDTVVLAWGDTSGDRRLVAYVVPKQEPAPPSSELRRFLQVQLPTYMVPAAFVLLDVLPLTPNGKIDRGALPAPDLGRLELRDAVVAPRTAIEEVLIDIWTAVLKLDQVGIHDNFFDLGGHSLLAVQLFARINKLLGIKLPLASLFQAPTVAQLASLLSHEGQVPSWSSLVAIHPSGCHPPFFCVHGHGGDVLGFQALAYHLGPDQPFYGLQTHVLDGAPVHYSNIEDMAAHYIEEIHTVQPAGPYYLGGYCFGGVVAFEMARQLHAQGQTVALLVLLAAYAPGYPTLLPWRRRVTQRLLYHVGNLNRLSPQEKLTYLLNKGKLIKTQIVTKIERVCGFSQERESRVLSPYREIQEANRQAFRHYIPKVYPGRATLFRPSKQLAEHEHDHKSDSHMGWDGLAARGVEIYDVLGYSQTIIEDPQVRFLAKQLNACLHKARVNEPDGIL
jgi:amino acid adenylation domain-containing protein